MYVCMYIHVHTKPIRRPPPPLNMLQKWSKNATSSGSITWKQYLTLWLDWVFLKYITKKLPDQRCVNMFFVILPLVLVQVKGRNKSFLYMSLLSGLKPMLFVVVVVFLFVLFFQKQSFLPWSSLISILLSLRQHSQLFCLSWTDTYNILWFGPVLLGSSLLALLTKFLSRGTFLHPVTAYLKIKVTIRLHSYSL